MTNATLEKFLWPRTRVAEHGAWAVALRPEQPTAGSLVVVCREPVTAFGAVSPAAFAELAEVARRTEALLRAAVRYERINWLMLMMVDPDVHFHVIPRYQGTREIAGRAIADEGWPGPPKLAGATALDGAGIDAAAAALAALWERA